MSKMSKMSKTTLAVLAVAVVFVPALALAVAGLPNPTPPVTGTAVTLVEIQALITRVAQFLIVVSVIIAVIFIIWGGVMYMAARGDDTKVADAKKTIFNGIVGAAVVLGVGVILQTVAGLVTRTFFA